jgi:XrtN system VIT domain protein
MKKITTFLTQDPLYAAGFLLIILSAAVLVVTMPLSSENFTGGFFINYAISGGYLLFVFIRTLVKHGWRLSKGKINSTIMLLVLWFISAFALNREMNVFDSSVTWLSAWIIISSIALMLATMYAVLPKYINCIVFFFLGSALVVFIYYAIYLLPLYIISVIGIIAIGISLHTYIPLGLVIVSIIIIVRVSRQNRKMLYATIAGFATPVIIGSCLLFSWYATKSTC